MTREFAVSRGEVIVTRRVVMLARGIAVAVALAVAATFSQPISWGDVMLVSTPGRRRIPRWFGPPTRPRLRRCP